MHAAFGLWIKETTQLWTKETDYPAIRKAAINAQLCTFSANRTKSKRITDRQPELFVMWSTLWSVSSVERQAGTQHWQRTLYFELLWCTSLRGIRASVSETCKSHSVPLHSCHSRHWLVALVKKIMNYNNTDLFTWDPQEVEASESGAHFLLVLMVIN